MNYLEVLTALLSAISTVAADIASVEPTLSALWTDLQSAYAAVVSAITGGTTLTEDQVAFINKTLAAVPSGEKKA